ncbi:uncharacterized protein LOC127528849 [Erpetoichthys calabaricus]|uniref:uncharacterized protein LOC127528849 n=1 Tax=Erpetoichthys calabaricus TaxID=27687 RepID=UPI002234A645|nr:uncharacterized protein LOC127528849 [Erpetoichthys calabaricus]
MCVEQTHFQTLQGFPPDFLHDLLEGIVPVELSFCLNDLVSSKFFTLDYLNSVIQTFPYKFADSVNRPQKISKTFKVSRTIGGNGHENWTLLRLLPLMIGHLVPENNKTWGILMKLKDIVEILSSSKFTDESLCYLESKISDHRHLLQEVFPELKFRPKHHYLEHYPHLIRYFGPLLEFWTICFEGEHSFFKKVVRDVNNFRNILLTLSTHHQLLLAYHLEMPSIFKPALEVVNFTNVSLNILEISTKTAIQSKYKNVESVGLTSAVSLHGTKYSEGMFLSFGHKSGLPNFGKIVKVLIIFQKASFIVEPYMAWYVEHLRCFELCKGKFSDIIIVDPQDLNDYSPLSSHTIQGKKFISPKAFLVHWDTAQ